jgi:hypothetical protein
MNTWGKRPYVSLPETGSFEELTVKRLKFGDCPVSLPTDYPPINGSALSFDTNGIGTWSSGPPAAVQDRIQDAANTCSVVCSAAGDVTMAGAGGENVKCFGNEISLANGLTQIILFQSGVVMGGPDGELFYTDSNTTRMTGPGGAAQVALKGNEVEIIAPGLQLLLPGSAADKVLTCLDDTGVAEWREPAIPVQIQDALNSNSAVECDVDNIYIEPGTDLMINLPSGNGADKVLTCVDDDGFVEWRDPAPAAIPSRIQDLDGAVVECVSGNIDIIPTASKQVTIGASAVATSKITLQSAALQVSIPSVGINNVLTSIDAVGNAEWRPIPAVTAPDRITNTSGTMQVICNNTNTLVVKAGTDPINTPAPGRVLTCVDNLGTCDWRVTLGFTAVFGGLANNLVLRQVLKFNGNSATTLSNNTNDVGATFVAPQRCYIRNMTYDMSAGDSTTAFTIAKNLTNICVFNPIGLVGRRGTYAFIPLSGQTSFLTDGDAVGVRWSGGTAPNNCVISLYLIPFT